MIIAVDTGGTKTLVARFSDNGELETSSKFPTPQSINDYLKEVAIAIHSVSGGANPSTIAVALPGTIKDGVLIRCGNLAWHDFGVQREFKVLFPNSEILVENDANLGGLGEVRKLDNAPERCLYVTVSTGIGGGFILNGAIDQTLSSCEIGLMRIEIDDEIVKWETAASGKALAALYHTQASDMTDKRHWNAVAHRLARGFFALLPVINPDLIIIGGGVGAHFEHFSEELRLAIDTHMSAEYRCPFVEATHPEEAVIYGCYYLAHDYATN